MLRHQPRDFAWTRRRIDAADQQALAVPGGQQIERIVDPERPAGQHHDAVGVARGRTSATGIWWTNQKKSAAEQRHRETQDQQHGAAAATARRRGCRPRPGVLPLS